MPERHHKKSEVVLMENSGWFVFALGSFISFGMVNVLFKVGAESGLNEVVVAIALYLTAGALALVYCFTAGVESESGVVLKSIALGVVIGVFSLAGTLFYQIALQRGPGSLATPVMSLNGMLVVLVSLLIYGEELTAVRGLGILLAFIAMVLIRL
jgi:uncharacterized membrane protein